jgi:hypothetical protein
MSRRWQKVSLAEARIHPLYGVKNWLVVFAIGVLLGGLRALGELNGEAHNAGLTLNELLGIDHPAITFAKLTLGLNALILIAIYWALFSKHPKFRLIASSTLLASWPTSALLGILYPFDGLAAVLSSSFIPYAISCGAWVTYLNTSKRVRVTFENTVLVEVASLNTNAAPLIADRQVRIAAATAAPPRAQPMDPPQQGTTDIRTEVCPPETTLEQFWAAALDELEGPARRPGVWARSFSEANGDEAIARARYLRYRSSELQAEYRVATLRESEAEASQRRNEEPRHLSEAERGYASLQYGVCPNCATSIPLSSECCPKCDADFGVGSAWTVRPK